MRVPSGDDGFELVADGRQRFIELRNTDPTRWLVPEDGWSLEARRQHSSVFAHGRDLNRRWQRADEFGTG